jgi:methyl-accepting chemotaxis protein
MGKTILATGDAASTREGRDFAMVHTDRDRFDPAALSLAVDAVRQRLAMVIGQVREAADSIHSAATVIGASNVTVLAGARAGDAARMIDEIAAASRRISDLIGEIDGIAFQADVLALNAVLESARAGEPGAGLALAASEVRNLAQRAASAAREIRALIGEPATTVDGASPVH